MKTKLLNKSNIFRHFFGGLIAFAMLAFAGNAFSQTVFIGNTQLTIPATGTKYYTYSESGNSVLTESTSSDYNVAVSKATDGTLNLTFNNLNPTFNHYHWFTFYGGWSAAASVYLDYGSPTILTLEGKNSLVGLDTTWGYSFSLYSAGSLAIKGSGIIDAKGGDASNVSYGIYVEKNLVVSDESHINVTGRNKRGDSFGICAGNLTISDKSHVSATGGCAICVNGDATISDKSQVIAIADTNGNYSFGIYAEDILNISDESNVTSSGGESQYISSGIAVKTMIVSGKSQVRATGNLARAYSCGIEMDSISISGESNVTSKGGKSGWYSYGIYAGSSDVIINTTGSVTAVAGEADFSYGVYFDSPLSKISILSGNVTIQGMSYATNTTPVDLSKYFKPTVIASYSYDGSDPVDSYDFTAENTYKYLQVKFPNIADARIAGVNESYEVEDNPIRPKITVLINGRPLAEGTDYEVSYGANNKVGTGTVTVTGIGDYKGTKTVNFNIETRKYIVTLPEVKNAVTNPTAGYFRVEEGKDFVFTVAPDKGYAAKVVTDQGETLYPYDGNHYMIVGLKWDTRVYIDVLKSTSAESIEALNVWSKDGNVIIASPKTARVYVVNIVGQIAKATTIPAGTTTIGGLSAGVYIVKVGTKTAKVVVR